MSKNVFANGNEISAKADGNKSMCAMPDVCLSPPSPPAGPIPIPYPNTSFAKDTSDGTKTVKIGGKEAGIKNKSNYKKSVGNQPATRNFGMGVISHKIEGKLKHAAWSFDVKFEGSNVIRHMDMTTHNHMNSTNGAMTLDTGKMFSKDDKPKDCKDLQDDQEVARTTPPKPTRSQRKKRVTLTTAQYQSGDGQYSMKAFSRKLKNKPGWANGVGAGGSSQLCEEAKFDYKRKNFMPHSSHTESRIIEDIFAAQGPNPGGTLTMRIQWNRGRKRPDTRPCRACKALICAAQKCGLEIKICNDNDAKNGTEGQSPKCP